MYTTLETERLRIRPITLGDVAFMVDLVNSEGWLKFIGNRNVHTNTDAKQYIQKVLDNTNFYYNVFELKNTHKPIGIVTLRKRENERFPDIGFALLPEFEKNGYTVEASKAYLQKIEDSTKYDNIIAITLPDNRKSIRVIQKLGFTYEGNHKKGATTLSYYSLKR